MKVEKRPVLLKDATCAAFIICLNLYYLISISPLSEKIPVAETALLAFGIVSLIFHYISIAYRKTNLNLLIILFFLIVVGGVAFYFSGGPTLLKLVLFSLAVVEVDIKDALRYYYYSLMLGILIICGSSFIGIIPKEYPPLPGVYTFGFVNPNNLLMIYVAAIMAYNLFHEGRIKIRVILLELIVGLGIFHFTNSRTGILVTVLYLIGLIVGKIDTQKNFSKRIMAVGNYLFIILSAASLFLALGYERGNSTWEKIDIALSWRPFLWGRYFDNYRISFFGTRLDAAQYGSLDNAYLTLLLKYGIVVFVVYLVLFVMISRRAVRQNRWELVACIIAYEIYFISEFGPVLINVNIALLVEIHYLVNKMQINQGAQND